MFGVDSSTLIAYIEGQSGPDVDLLDSALNGAQASLPPVVLTEVLSDPNLPGKQRQLLLDLPVLELSPGYWERAALTRATILGLKLRARLPDALITQSCIDHDVVLITRDADFRHFAKHCGLKLA